MKLICNAVSIHPVVIACRSTVLLDSSKMMVFHKDSSLVSSVHLCFLQGNREKQSLCLPLHFDQFLCRQFPPICSLLCREEERLSVTGQRRQEGAQVSMDSNQGAFSRLKGGGLQPLMEIQQQREKRTAERGCC